MKKAAILSTPFRLLSKRRPRPAAALVVATFLALLACESHGAAQELANPHWNIAFTDYGYSDFMFDNTPGFEGREYLSGEWGAAVAYQVAGRPAITPQWLEPHFIFPDWNTLSPFHVVATWAPIGLNADGLPIAQSIIANDDLEITLRYEMLDTVVGTPMGITPASSTGEVRFIQSDRYVLKQTCTLRNISGAAMSRVQFFQLLHGLVAQRGVFDDRVYAGPLSEFHHDVTQAGVDGAAVGSGSSSDGLEDFIGFHASVAPSAFEIGYFGIEGNGVDDHAFGKPSDGVHLSIENNWQNAPYDAREGRDSFAPPQRWVAGAQRWDLGALAAGQSVSIDVLLTLRTGTRVQSGNNSSGGCNGGSSVAGGFDYEFEDVSSEGSCFGEYSSADESEIEVRIAEGEFEPFTFMIPAQPAQVWEVEFSGTFAGAVDLNFGYDASLVPPGFDEDGLCLYHFSDGEWQRLAGTVNPAQNTIAVTVESLGVFALGADSGVTFTIAASAAPANGGTVTGDGSYADGASATIVAAADAGFVFAGWKESDAVVSLSPGYTFIVHADRTFVAHFLPVGDGRSIGTSSLPSNGGSTSGDGEYPVGASATVSATPNAGYKFSKWLENDLMVSEARDYTFTVTGNRNLVAKFKPVYSVVVTAEPENGGEAEADPFYEPGELAVLKAKPNDGWSFVHWTQNGTPVSDDAFYSFNVTGNRELVAHFAPGHRIDVLAEPVNAGTATGGGVYLTGATVTLQAEAHPGYVFLSWTENGTLVSTSASYSFASDASRQLVANFMAQPTIRISEPGAGMMLISWPAGSSVWKLQETSDLRPGNWADSTQAVDIVSGRCQVTMPSPLSSSFYRLCHPSAENAAIAAGATKAARRGSLSTRRGQLRGVLP